MGNKRWNYKVLKNDRVYELLYSKRELLRIEVYDGSPHLKIQDGNELKTLGRIRKNLFQELPTVLLENQKGYINVREYRLMSKDEEWQEKRKEFAKLTP